MATKYDDLFTLTAAEIMSRAILMVPREMSLEGAARMLARSSVTGAPVVDSCGRCIGVLSATDFMHWVEKDRPLVVPNHPCEFVCKAWQIPDGVTDRPSRVEDCMTKNPVLVGPHVKIGQLAYMMMDAHIHRLIVVDSSDHPIGIVSSTDILAALSRAAHGESEVVEQEEMLAGVV